MHTVEILNESMYKSNMLLSSFDKKYSNVNTIECRVWLWCRVRVCHYVCITTAALVGQHKKTQGHQG